MKIAPIVVAASLAALSGCAGMTTGNGSHATTAASGGAYYCWKDRLDDSDSNLVCNWERSKSAACESVAVVTLPKSSVSGAPQTFGRCENGQWIVTVMAR
jgi:hypothetical protein